MQIRERAVYLARGALSGFFFLSYGLAALPFAPILMLPIWNGRAMRLVVRVFYRIFVFFAGLTNLYRIEMDESTKAQLNACQGKIVVMNHLSLIDICILMALLPDSTALAKAAAKNNPFLAMTVKKALIANDEDPIKVIEEVKRFLQQGVNVIIFPQGTRGGKRLRRGAARLALAAKAEISVFHIAYDPLPLAKGQPWWDVGNREIVISLTGRGVVKAEGENTHANAIKLTELIGAKIG